MPKQAWALTCFLVLPALCGAVPTTYTYTGVPYATTSNDDPPPGFYTTAMRVAGFITLQDAIAANTDTGTFFGDAPEVLAFSFNDGRFSYRKGEVIPFGAGFSLVTNASGDISAWRVNIFSELPAPGFSSAQFTASSDCGVASACDSASATAIATGLDSAQSFAPGTWTVASVPEPGIAALFVVGIAFVGFASYRVRRT
jgi:hypothetical protein